MCLVCSALCGIVLVQEPWLGQIPHRQGRLGFLGVGGCGAVTLVEVRCRPSSSMVRLWPVLCACHSTLGNFLRGASIPSRCPLPGARMPYLLPEDGVRGVGLYHVGVALCTKLALLRMVWSALVSRGGHRELPPQMAHTV